MSRSYNLTEHFHKRRAAFDFLKDGEWNDDTQTGQRMAVARQI
jgi:hypothetical protein